MHRNEMEARIALLYDLCHRVHGAGVDDAWKFTCQDLAAKSTYTIVTPTSHTLDHVREKVMNIKSKVLRLDNSFHCLNDAGFYCGWAPFSIIFPNNKPVDEYRLVFRGQTAQQLQRKHDIREYLDQLIIGAIYDIQKEQEAKAKESDQG